MAHYFTDQSEVEDRPFEIHFDLMDRSFSLHSNLGVFSKDKLDEGTRLLLENVLKEQEPPKNCLDLGCGIGVVSIVLKSFWDTKMTLSIPENTHVSYAIRRSESEKSRCMRSWILPFRI